jgi:hypothetical protein
MGATAAWAMVGLMLAIDGVVTALRGGKSLNLEHINLLSCGHR